jgi:hypothetical protein
LLFPGKLPLERLGTLTRRIGTIQHFRWLGWIVWGTLVLNVVDAFLTLYWITSGLATEANPLMAVLIEEHPLVFIVVKFSLVFLGSTLLWRYRKRPLSVICIFLAFMVYYGVVLYHLNAAQMIWFR